MSTRASEAAGLPEDEAPRLTKHLDDVEQRPRANDDRIRELVSALGEVGDTRNLWALRRVAREDRGKTSWGESVADTAQLALDRLQSRLALLRFSEPVKTALVFVAMFSAVLFAAARVQDVIAELRRDVPVPSVAVSGTTATAAAGTSSATKTAAA